MCMDSELYVQNLLESFPQTSRQIELMRYELKHVPQVTEDEIIETMSFRQSCIRDDIQSFSKAVPDIAQSYKAIAVRINQEAVDEIVSRYTELCLERERLLYYVGLLDQRQQSVLQKYYFLSLSWKEIAQQMNITIRSAQRIRQQAITELSNLYSFAKDVFKL